MSLSLSLVTKPDSINAAEWEVQQIVERAKRSKEIMKVKIFAPYYMLSLLPLILTTYKLFDAGSERLRKGHIHRFQSKSFESSHKPSVAYSKK
ncbi:hypothetical protein TL16_g05855 [Triparma laevis f. inornata]|uniref:Uncharacterized protein n=1 Tax=Triparma laevis f. inornata TaxID=1714386 RepID=A0A9W7EB45_9STRA|nr:hypothetical protein TL16_g05855 [Triparma laevis f. inornata]